MSKIIATEKSSQKQMEFDTIQAAAEATGVDRRLISRAVADPFHWVHQDGLRQLKDGTYSVKRQGCKWDFWKEPDKIIAELWPADGSNIGHQSFTSMIKLAEFLGIHKVQLYRLRKTATVGEPLPDKVTCKEGYEWLLVFLVPVQDVPNKLKNSKEK